MEIIGIILIVMGIILFFVRRNQIQTGLSLKSARVTTIGELKNTAQAIEAEIGGGNWRDYVKLWGKVTAEEPLLSEIKKEACVYYTMTVKREYEEKVREQDQQGNWVEKTQRKSETVANNQRSIPFILEDETGTIVVNSEKAQIETIKVLDEFRPGEAPAGMIGWGSFSLLVHSSSTGTQSRTLGYHYRESILPVGREVLVIGEVSDETGKLRIGIPSSSQQKFIISFKTNEALSASLNQSAKNIFSGMVACLIIGVILFLIGLIW
jgi:hypothetical protein